jgi:hypothetical protein
LFDVIIDKRNARSLLLSSLRRRDAQNTHPQITQMTQ